MLKSIMDFVKSINSNVPGRMSAMMDTISSLWNRLLNSIFNRGDTPDSTEMQTIDITPAVTRVFNTKVNRAKEKLKIGGHIKYISDYIGDTIYYHIPADKAEKEKFIKLMRLECLLIRKYNRLDKQLKSIKAKGFRPVSLLERNLLFKYKELSLKNKSLTQQLVRGYAYKILPDVVEKNERKCKLYRSVISEIMKDINVVSVDENVVCGIRLEDIREIQEELINADASEVTSDLIEYSTRNSHPIIQINRRNILQKGDIENLEKEIDTKKAAIEEREEYNNLVSTSSQKNIGTFNQDIKNLEKINENMRRQLDNMQSNKQQPSKNARPRR